MVEGLFNDLPTMVEFYTRLINDFWARNEAWTPEEEIIFQRASQSATLAIIQAVENIVVAADRIAAAIDEPVVELEEVEHVNIFIIRRNSM